MADPDVSRSTGSSLSRLTVFTPMRVEQAAVRGALPGATVLRTGMGMRRAADRLRHFRDAEFPDVELRTGDAGLGPVAVLGVAGGIAPQVRPGDVIVASEVRSEAGVFPCPWAPLLAAPLRRAGSGFTWAR